MHRTILRACALAFALVTTAANAETGYVAMPDSERLFYERAGQGRETIVVPLHIFTYDWLRALSDEYTIIGYDVRNRGQSDYVENTATLSIQQDIADLETLRRHFKIEKMHLVGHSYAGLMVYLYAQAHPDRVARIVQLGPVAPVFTTQYRDAYVHRDEVAKVEEEALGKLRGEGVRDSDPPRYCLAVWAMWQKQLVGSPDRVPLLRGMDRKVCALRNELIANFNRHLEHHFGSIQALKVDKNAIRRFQKPVLTIHGTRDRNAAYGAGREWVYLLPNARLLTVDGAAHEVHAEEPERVIAAIRTFLRGGWPAGAERVTESPVKTE
jgi:proline iminopeptidase